MNIRKSKFKDSITTPSNEDSFLEIINSIISKNQDEIR